MEQRQPKKIAWEGTVLYETTPLDDGPPPEDGMELATCTVAADVRGDLLVRVLEKAITDGVVAAGRDLFVALGGKADEKECVRWVVEARKVKELRLGSAASYRGPLPLVGVTTTYWARLGDVLGKVGWEAVDRKKSARYGFREVDGTTSASAEPPAFLGR